MRKSVEVKQGKKAHASTTKPTTMSDADTDKVAGGFSTDNEGWHGAGTGFSGNDNGLGAGKNNSHGRF